MKTIRETKLDKLALRLVEKGGEFIGLIFADGTKKIQIEGTVADDVWRRLHDEAGKVNQRYFGFDGARARFLQFFPNGFHSAGYEGEERDFKIAAKSKLDAAVPIDAAASGAGFGEAILSVFRASNLLYPVEKTRLQGLLRGPDADAFVRAAARFALGETKSALARMESALRPHDNAKWTVVTTCLFSGGPRSICS